VSPQIVEKSYPCGTGQRNQMAKPTKAIHEQKQVDAEELTFKIVGPPEVVLDLEDGTTLKILVTPAKVVRLKDIYNDEGEPMYQVKWGTGISASVPPNLLKAPAAKKAEGGK
jgi:hypothetical protein